MEAQNQPRNRKQIQIDTNPQRIRMASKLRVPILSINSVNPADYLVNSANVL